MASVEQRLKAMGLWKRYQEIAKQKEEKYLDTAGSIVKDATKAVKSAAYLPIPKKGSIKPGQDLPASFADPIKRTLDSIQKKIPILQGLIERAKGERVRQHLKKDLSYLEKGKELTEEVKNQGMSIAVGKPKKVYPLSKLLDIPPPYSKGWLEKYAKAASKPKEEKMSKAPEEVEWHEAKQAAVKEAEVKEKTKDWEFKTPRRQVLEAIVDFKHAFDKAGFGEPAKQREIKPDVKKWAVKAGKALGYWYARRFAEAAQKREMLEELKRERAKAKKNEMWTLESYLGAAEDEMEEIEKEKYPK